MGLLPKENETMEEDDNGNDAKKGGKDTQL